MCSCGLGRSSILPGMKRGQRIAADWYDDPQGEPGVVRYHDGKQWTERTQSRAEGMAEEQVELLRAIARETHAIQSMMQALTVIAVFGVLAGIVALVIVNS